MKALNRFFIVFLVLSTLVIGYSLISQTGTTGIARGSFIVGLASLVLYIGSRSMLGGSMVGKHSNSNAYTSNGAKTSSTVENTNIMDSLGVVGLLLVIISIVTGIFL